MVIILIYLLQKKSSQRIEKTFIYSSILNEKVSPANQTLLNSKSNQDELRQTLKWTTT